MTQAKKCDEERQAAISNGTPNNLPFLHGIPISIKDLFDKRGSLSTVGCAHNNKIKTYDSQTWTPAVDAGAIPIVKGNVPQGALSIHTTNYIWGTAQNPYDKTRSCGGSSGGDAGLVAARCIPLSIGSDVGGSIRIPATFNGVMGFKPTQDRISYEGACCARLNNFFGSEPHLPAVAGPFAHSANDCIEFFKI